MWSILKGEWRKLRRCQILLVGIVALALCPVVQYGTQLIINPEMRDQNYNFIKLFSNVIWGNTQIFLPISLVMIGGWLINRENTNDTIKNLLTVPISYPKLLIGKLMVHPEHQGNGLGSCLLQELEKNCPAPRLELFTSNKSLRNLCLYERNGYTRCAEKAVSPALTLIFLEKKPSHPASAQNPV